MAKKIKIVGLSVLLSVFYSSVWAKKVDLENAERVVNRYAELQYKHLDRQNIQLRYTENIQGLQKSTEIVCYYVFDVGNNGFVIVAGDDVVKPILGYSENGNYDSTNLPPAFVYWLDCLQQEITYAIENNLPQTPEIKAMWDNYLNVNAKQSGRQKGNDVLPLIQTKWHQTPPYNNLCPTIAGAPNSNGRAYTGCVATAMAQLMKYYNHPPQGSGQSEAYTTEPPSSIPIPSVNLNVNYAWDKMTNTYSSSSTTEEKDAVSTLMYHCGASIEINYQATATAGSYRKVATSLVEHYDYDASRELKYRKYYNNTEWENLLKEQLDLERPVLYSGQNEKSGHAFICDGYDDNGLFHFNWGWGSSKDGYFVTTALNPGSGEAGSGAGTYNIDQAILVDVIPNRGGMPPPAMPKSYIDMTATSQSVDRNELFEVSTSLVNAGLNPFSCNLGIAIVDANDNILEIIGVRPSFISNLQSGYRYLSTIKCAMPEYLTPGNYTIRTIAKPLGKSWMVMKGEIGMKDTLRITVKNGIIPDSSNLRLYGSNNQTFTLNPNPIQGGEPLIVEFGLYNNGKGDFFGEISLGLYDTLGNLVELIEKLYLAVTSSTSWNRFTFNSSNITALCGGYIMTLCKKTAAGDIVKVAPYTSSTSSYLNDMDVAVTGTAYTVTFDMRGGNSMPPQSLRTCDPLPIPSPRTGYTFAGWFTDPAFHNAWPSNHFLTRDTTLYAKWTDSLNSTNFTQQNGNIKLYPNPTNGTLHVTFGNILDSKDGNIEIFNVAGQVLFVSAVSQKSPEKTIDINHLANGMYFLKVDNRMYKIIKQ
jgi:uncharacterized repeat protein (TIGR02543 family)